jgi:hypothetical protein
LDLSSSSFLLRPDTPEEPTDHLSIQNNLPASPSSPSQTSPQKNQRKHKTEELLAGGAPLRVDTTSTPLAFDANVGEVESKTIPNISEDESSDGTLPPNGDDNAALPSNWLNTSHGCVEPTELELLPSPSHILQTQTRRSKKQRKRATRSPATDVFSTPRTDFPPPVPTSVNDVTPSPSPSPVPQPRHRAARRKARRSVGGPQGSTSDTHIGPGRPHADLTPRVVTNTRQQDIRALIREQKRIQKEIRRMRAALVQEDGV